MKAALISFVVVLACVLPLRADNLLQNGDFTSGVDHWYGDGQTPEQMAGDDPTATPNPLFAKGMIIPLKSGNWSKISQDFHGNISSGVVTVSYMVTPDFSLSTNAEDYKNVPDHLNDDDWKPFDTEPSVWVIFVKDFGTKPAHGLYTKIKVKGGSGVMGGGIKVKGLTPQEDHTLEIAFPPGQGSIILLNVTVTPS